MAGHSTSRMQSTAAPYMVRISLPRPNSTPMPFEPTVTAMAAPTPSGARYITYLVYWNITSASDSQNATTGAAFAPMAAHAAPNRNAKTTICSTSLRAMASMMLVGTICSTNEPAVVCVCGTAASAAVRARGTPTPGRTRFTAANPRNSASVVTISK